jgi:ATP-dependent DNA helicase RecQ
VHHDLPKNIEGYYQETGRAGRDGLPGDCLLLFSGGDVAKQTHFIEQVTDPQEQQLARNQLRQMAQYAESAGCRRRELLAYFGETFGADSCGACDNCLEPRDTYDGTLVAQKLLSCVYRIRQASGFSVGLNHVVEVLTGAETERIRRWNHHQLSTYGIGRDLPRPAWLAIGRELLRLGHLAVSEGEFPTIDLTPEGLDVLRRRLSVALTRPMESPKARRVTRREGEIACDEILFESLRVLRKRLADERRVPAYIVLGDASLRQMARLYPSDVDAMNGITGMGERKRAEFAAIFAEAVASHLRTHGRMSFND